jgi:poly-gamma-glutamate synthesis protein (capsule biosynthesis protein)
VWGDLLPELHACDLRIVNLECAIARPDVHPPWTPPKAFHFLAGPRATDVLNAAAIDLVTLANNHTLDFREGALLETIERLDSAGIAHAGAGPDAREARRPAVLSAPSGDSVAVLAFTDNEPRWEAADDRPGVHYVPVRLDDPRATALRHSIAEAAKSADLVLVAGHWGPNMLDRPLPHHPPFARALIDAGAHVFVGHSAHAFQGVEGRDGRSILYDLGDFVDDYAVDRELRNDRSFLWILDSDGSGVSAIECVPVVIDARACRVGLATGAEARAASERLIRLCAEMGTAAEWAGDRVAIALR